MDELLINAKGLNLNATPRKLSLIANLVRGKGVADALMILSFCQKKAAVDVSKVLRSAVFNAQNNYDINIDKLAVKEVLVSKSKASFYRVSPRARGKACRIRKYRGNIIVKLSREV